MKFLLLSHPLVITSVISLLHVFSRFLKEWLLLSDSPERLFQFIPTPCSVGTFYTHNIHSIPIFDYIQFSQSCEVGFVVLIFPLSSREQPWVSSDHYRALPDPFRTHSQDYQSGMEPTSWWKAGICFLWWYSSGTVAFCGFFTMYSNLNFPLSPQFFLPLPLSSTEGIFFALEGFLVLFHISGPFAG